MPKQQTNGLSRLLTVEEVADLLQIPVKTLYTQRYRGTTPGSLGIRVGRYVRFRADVLANWLEDQRGNWG